MASEVLVCGLLVLAACVNRGSGQIESVGDNIFDSLEKLGCTTFKSIVLAGNMEYDLSSQVPMTLFAFDDEAIRNMPRNILENLFARPDQGVANEAEEYVRSFTLGQAVDESSFSSDEPYSTLSLERRKLFITQKQLRYGNVASGQVGPKKSFVNGAMITRPNIRAGQHVIHIVDRFLELSWPKSAEAYVNGLNPNQVAYRFKEELMVYLQRSSTPTNIENNYNTQVRSVLSDNQVTFFLPSDEAISRIPPQILVDLRGDYNRLLDIVTLHIIPQRILYTSLVNHNEGFRTQREVGRITFRKYQDREAVFVTGSMAQGHPVTAKLSPANITVYNGVVHHIDAVLGLVFRTAYEEIYADPELRNFQQVVRKSRSDLRNVLQNQVVVIFAPISSAVIALNNVYPNYINNQTLIDQVMLYSMLQQDEQIRLTDYNGGYESLISAKSRYNGRLIKIYSQGNDTWAEGGYVRARVLKPDIGVTNGLVHQIDAVFGVPTRDIPHTVFCEDRLQDMYAQLEFTDLVDYMHDPHLIKNQGCTFRNGDDFSNTGATSRDVDYSKMCGGGGFRCEFTFFVPNDTALEKFARNSNNALQLMDNKARWKWVLRRLITFRQKIYLDQIAPGAPYSFIADTGEEVFLQVDSRNSIASGRRTAFIMFGGARAEVIHSDIGATNGVIHIINEILVVPEDVYRNPSSGTGFSRGAGSIPRVSLLLVLFMVLICGGNVVK